MSRFKANFVPLRLIEKQYKLYICLFLVSIPYKCPNWWKFSIMNIIQRGKPLTIYKLKYTRILGLWASKNISIYENYEENISWSLNIQLIVKINMDLNPAFRPSSVLIIETRENWVVSITLCGYISANRQT